VLEGIALEIRKALIERLSIGRKRWEEGIP